MMKRSHRPSEPEAIVDELARAVIRAAIEVHRGPGYVKAVYKEALAVKMRLRGIPFVRQCPMRVVYKGHEVGECQLDFLVGEVLMGELKAVVALTPVHKARVISLLKATDNHLLINFSVPLLRECLQRVVLS